MLKYKLFLFVIVQVFLGLAHFVVVILCSIALGCLFGAITSFTTKYTEHVHGKCISMLCIVCIVSELYIIFSMQQLMWYFAVLQFNFELVILLSQSWM